MTHPALRNIVFGLTMLATACGGESGGGSTSPIVVVPPTSGTPTPPTPPTSSACSLRARQDFALATLREWYLFPETLPASLDPSPYTTVGAYIDALTATARGQGRDRFFTYITSIAEENAFFASGSSAGFGVRLALDTSNRLLITEAFEGAPALAAGIDRGTEILAIGTSSANLRNVSDILASEGSAGLSAALGPSDPGTTRVFRIRNASGTNVVTVAKQDFELQPISPRYGAKIINDGGQNVGYINMRTFISTADDQLRTAFANFRAQGVTNFIIDLRYNGGGLVNTAEVMGDLLGRNRSTGDVFSRTTFRPEKASNNSVRNFQTVSQSVAPARIAFIATGATASASELVMNSMIPYLGVNEALIGSDSYGKPVGQVGIDRAACDDRIRVVAFSTQNSANDGFYYTGIASKMRASCAAPDDLTMQLGDPQEASVRAALDFIAGRSCTTPIAATGSAAQATQVSLRRMLEPAQPSPAQRETPGLY